MKNTLRPYILLIATLLLLAPQAIRALEVSLEENRGERGSIGYVDLHRIFQRFPETHRARQNFQEIVRQAEEQVNLRKAELVALRADLSRLTLEHELMLKTPMEIPASPTLAPVKVQEPLKPTQIAPAALEDPKATPSTTPPDIKLPAKTETLLPGTNKPLFLNLPGLTNDPLPIEPPTTSTGAQASSIEPIQTSTQPTLTASEQLPSAPPPPSPIASAPQPTATDLATAAARTHQERLLSLQAQIEAKNKEIVTKTEESLKHQEQVEKNLLELESRRTEILLGKIYTVVQEVAHENGVSVVVDKGQILFGQKTVDLTDKVLKRLTTL